MDKTLNLILLILLVCTVGVGALFLAVRANWQSRFPNRLRLLLGFFIGLGLVTICIALIILWAGSA